MVFDDSIIVGEHEVNGMQNGHFHVEEKHTKIFINFFHVVQDSRCHFGDN